MVSADKVDAKMNYENVIILLMGFAGTGKRTIGQELSKLENFRFVHHHDWIDPILNLLGTNSLVWWDLNQDGWKKINDVRDIIFSTIADVSPRNFNFIITFELVDKDPYHQIFYNKLLEVVEKRHATFMPVRLICNEAELVERLQSTDRNQYLKLSDKELAQKRVREQQVFYSGHKNEISIDVTNLTAIVSAKKILDALKSIY